MWYVRSLLLILIANVVCLHSDTGDFNTSDLPVEVPVGSIQACFQFEAIDDEIVENDEAVSLIVDTLNPYDTIASDSTIIISDNDGR